MFTDIEQLEKEIQAFKKNILASNELIQTIESVVAATKKQNADYQTATSALQDKMDSHTEGLKKVTADAIEQMLAESKKTTGEVQGIANKTITELTASNKALLADTVAQFNAAQKTYIEALETVKAAIGQNTADNEKQLKEATEALRTAQKDYYDRLAQLETSIKEVHTQSLEAMKSAMDSATEEQRKQLAATTEELHKQLNAISEVIRAAQKEHLDRLTQIEEAVTASKNELEAKYAAFLEKLESTNVDQIFKVCQEMKKSVETKLLLLTGGVGIAIILMIVSFFIK